LCFPSGILSVRAEGAGPKTGGKLFPSAWMFGLTLTGGFFNSVVFLIPTEKILFFQKLLFNGNPKVVGFSKFLFSEIHRISVRYLSHFLISRFTLLLPLQFTSEYKSFYSLRQSHPSTLILTQQFVTF
jgi:hypothetical protein